MAIKLTNKMGFPSAVVNALLNDSYDRGNSDWTATQLIGPPKIQILMERHKDELEEDASDVLYRLYGKIAHTICEQANENEIVEVRYYGKYLGYNVSAQVDNLCLIKGTLSDYKMTSLYAFKYGSEPKPEWVAQLNIQLDLLRKNGLDATQLQIVGLLRDWTASGVGRIRNYPASPIMIMRMPVWTRTFTQKFIRGRIRALEEASKKLPMCTKEETWSGRRCANYCVVSKFCDQYKQQTREMINE